MNKFYGDLCQLCEEFVPEHWAGGEAWDSRRECHCGCNAQLCENCFLTHHRYGQPKDEEGVLWCYEN
jgi:hypothetical protein